MRFREFFVEDVTPKQYKSYIAQYVKSKGIKPTASSRGGVHIRFPLEGNLNDFNEFFKDAGIKVSDSSKSISGTFETYDLTQTKEVQNIPIGTEMLWVNNVTGLGTKTNKLFNTKELTPDALGLAGGDLTVQGIITQTTKALSTQFEPAVVKDLNTLMKLSTTNSNKISIPSSMNFNTKDLATISKDFGEIMSAIWAISNLKFNTAYFPLVSNEQLIDFYGTRMGIRYPISVKSGGGGKVTIQNIIDAIKNRAKTAKMDHSEEKSLRIFQIVNQNSAKPGMLMLHQEMNTDAINVLGNLMGIKPAAITIQNLKEWLEQYSNEELKKILEPFHSSLNTKLTDPIWKRDDKLRFVISPLGELIWKELNNSPEIQQSLTNVARQVLLIQINVNVKTSTISFQNNRFKDADFQFGWAGYAAGNKLGFKMKVH